MKKYLFHFLFILSFSTVLVSCDEGLKVVDNGSNSRICDYLYAIEYDDYDFDLCVQSTERLRPAAAGCSEARKGDFVGRNLDWYINNDASAIIKINGKEGRYASLGVVGCLPKFSSELAASGEPSDVYSLLPFFTVDGVNEKGLYIGVNVMPTGETSFDSDTWETGKWGHGAAYTNPGSDKTYCVTYLVRVVLDNAASVDEAKELIRSINWFEPVNFPHPGDSQAFHWLIADGTKTAVAEFLDNQICFTESDVIDKPSYATVMTNFTNKLMADEGLVQISGMGYERWDTLFENYDSTPYSPEGMEDLMKTVWYTKFFTTEPGSEHYMLTDFAGPEFPAYDLYKHYEIWSDESFLEKVQHSKDVFNDKSNWHTPESTLWYTTHTSIYDIKNLELRVMVHEGLDGQQEFFKADFNSYFVKPLERRAD